MAAAESAILVKDLNETAIRYNRDIKYTPIASIMTPLALAGIGLVPGIQNKMVNYLFLRRGGIMRPYFKGLTASTNELGKFVENEFQVRRVAGIDKDYIQAYRTTNAVGMNIGRHEMNLTSPALAQIMYAKAVTWGEDLLDILYHAKYEANGKTKYESFDGYETLIRKYIEDGSISEDNHNYVVTDPITYPVDKDDTTAFDIVDDFLSRTRIRGEAILNVTPKTARNIVAATFNKFKFTMTTDEYGRYILPGYLNRFRLNPNEAMGEGDRMILTKADIFQLGYDTQFDDPLMRFRAIDDDDQILTINYGAEYGPNILSTHCKFMQVSSGTLEPVAYAGDYNGPDEFTFNITAGSNGKVAKSPEKSKYALGDSVILTATPNEGYAFEKWSDENTENPRLVTARKNLTLQATFKSVGG